MCRGDEGRLRWGELGQTLPMPGPGAAVWGKGRHQPCLAAEPGAGRLPGC